MTGFTCCLGSKWSAVIGLGSAESFDFILGRCDGCDRYWMNIWSPVASIPRYLPVAGDDAERLSAMPAGTARKRCLADWFEAR